MRAASTLLRGYIMNIDKQASFLTLRIFFEIFIESVDMFTRSTNICLYYSIYSKLRIAICHPLSY